MRTYFTSASIGTSEQQIVVRDEPNWADELIVEIVWTEAMGGTRRVIHPMPVSEALELGAAIAAAASAKAKGTLP